jgi:hypothetical protein
METSCYVKCTSARFLRRDYWEEIFLSDDQSEDPLWPVLVEAVHSLILYRHHKAYVRDVILHEKPELSPQDLALSLGVSLGEAMVILSELRGEEAE